MESGGSTTMTIPDTSLSAQTSGDVWQILNLRLFRKAFKNSRIKYKLRFNKIPPH